jgi:hypothetical protein
MLRNGPAREAQSMSGESIVQTAVTPLIDSLGMEEKAGGGGLSTNLKLLM